MLMREEKSVRALEWFVDFANLDLKQIGPGDKAKLLVESDHLWPIRELKSYCQGAPLSKKNLSVFSWVLELPGKKSPEYWNAIVAAQTGIRKLFSLLQITTHPSPENANAPSKAIGSVIRGHDEMLWWMVKGHGVPYTLTFLPVTKSQEDYTGLKILMLLRGLNQHAIRRCPGCGQWFLNPTDREKNFCGNRCIWRTNTAKRRKAAKEKSVASGKEKQARKAKGRRP
jgi:hypothetical protein